MGDVLQIDLRMRQRRTIFKNNPGHPISINGMALQLSDHETTVKSYYQFRIRTPRAGLTGGFFYGLADFACLGWDMCDLAGYPHEDEAAALYSDWVRLGQDFETASNKIKDKA